MPELEPECEQTFDLPRIVARKVDPHIFEVGRCSKGMDPQNLPRVIVPCVYILRSYSTTGPWFYVGVSSDVVSRIGQHFAGAGSTLTRRYRPVAVEAIVYNAGVGRTSPERHRQLGGGLAPVARRRAAAGKPTEGRPRSWHRLQGSQDEMLAPVGSSSLFPLAGTDYYRTPLRV